ncbi:MAG: hypothetical protein RL021_1162 [Bacteroidota bacterium]|jgi:L-alanine-DL-glutamate epimerase-like enolase superfamily enzyme
MRLRSISLIPIRIPLKEPFIISLGPLTHAENVVVRMETIDGAVGYGEASPFRTIHGESIRTCLAIGEDIANRLINTDCDDAEMLLSLMDHTVFGNTSIKSAFAIAFHDLLAQQKDVPLYKLLGGTSLRTLHTDYTVSLSDKEKMVSDAVWIRDKGFPVIKVKLGGDPLEDIRRIRAIRSAVGNDISIRIDANQGWDMQGAITALQGMADLHIEHCEEPLPRWNFDRLPELRRHVTIPLMADESCFNEFDAQRLIDSNACEGINIKLGKTSGFLRAARIAQAAKQAKLKLQVGGFLESRLGFSASAHFAMAHPEIDCIDFDTPLMFTEDPVQGGLSYGANGGITLEERPGLGAVLDEPFATNSEAVVIRKGL